MFQRNKKIKSERLILDVEGLKVEVVRKRNKNLYLRVHSSTGQVRVSAPLRVSNDYVRQFVLSKFDWIERKRSELRNRPHSPLNSMVDGEVHYFLGFRYRLRVIGHSGTPYVRLSNDSIELYVRRGANQSHKEDVLHRWYREQLQIMIPSLLDKWEPVVGVQAAECRIRRMKTRWGSCNVVARRVWLNQALIKAPLECLEYVLVHELVHLLERHHNDRFWRLVGKFMPDWQQRKSELRAISLEISPP